MYRFAKQQSPFIIIYYYYDYYFPPARDMWSKTKKDTGVFFFFFFLKYLKLPSKKSIFGHWRDPDPNPSCVYIYLSPQTTVHLSCCNTNRIISCLGLIPPQLLHLEAVDALCWVSSRLDLRHPPGMLCSLIDCVDVAEQPGKKERNIRLFVSVRGSACPPFSWADGVRPATTKEIVPI